MKIVGIGASAGGLKAMSSLLKHLPKDSGACFVFLQHLSPDSKTIMGELLAKHTDMPVELVYESQPVRANHLYIMPENKNLLFSHGMLIAKERDPSSALNLPIDAFFHSLGEHQGDDAIGVLLSGTGTDGTRGLRTIKEHGGIVLVQSLASAEFDGMPKAAIDLKIADEIATPRDLSAIILDLLMGLNRNTPPKVPEEPEDKPTFNRIVKLMSSKTGIDFSGYRPPTLLRRINNRMMIKHKSDLPDYLEDLKAEPEEMQVLFHDVLIGVTRFFRDPAAFEEIRSSILPKIFEHERPADEPYRFWVSACSTGEEAYSLAMLIDQYIQENDLKVDYKIFASDIDEGAIRFAIKGVYSASMVADTPKDLMAQYFIREGDEFKVVASLRKRIMFAVQNLLGDPPFIDMDLISCRNLLIYLKPQTQQKVLSTLHFALREEGKLFLGPSESLGALKYAFTQISRRWNMFEKHADARLHYDRSEFDLNRKHIQIKSSAPQKKSKMDYDKYDTDPFTRYLVERYAPISLFVNRDLDLLYINGDADRLLNIPRALAQLNLRRMLPPAELAKFQTGLEQVLEKRAPQSYSNITLSKGEQSFNARLRFDLPNLNQGEEDEQDIILIEIHLSGEAKKDEEPLSESDFKEAKEASLQRELQEAKRRSRELVDELESTNEELQTANRELMASNEELQSTNEELQSVNEELYTVNSELQLKNEELTTAHNDINNLLKSTEIGTIFLDKKLRIRKFTPAVKRQFNLLQSDIGRTITSFSNTFKELDIKKECEKVFDTLESFEREVVDDSGDHYLMRILPYRTEEDNIDGLVVTFIDINDLAVTQKRMDELAKTYKTIFNFSYSTIAVMHGDGIVESMNRPLGPYKPEQLVGKPLFEQLPEHIANELRSAFKQSLDQNRPQKLDIQIAPGQWLDISLIPNPYQEDEGEKGHKPVILMAEEAATGKEQVEQLEQSLEQFTAFMDSISQRMALVDEAGTIRYINKDEKQLQPLKGSSIFDQLPAEERKPMRAAINSIFNGTAAERVQFSLQLDGEPAHAKFVTTPVIIDNQIEYVAIVQDRRAADDTQEQ
ncbi:MAG: PAS domain-containing protein [Bacteroidetes bacterium]|jgi:two-component system CheB/CheR fusion protein|nr:PAS domain-containing protein [Bacteroidota bacterium]